LLSDPELTQVVTDSLQQLDNELGALDLNLADLEVLAREGR